MLKRIINRIPGVSCWSQNIAKEERADTKKAGRPYKGSLLSWRGCVFFGKSCTRQIGFEYCTHTSPGLYVQVDPGERAVKFHASIWIISWWLTFTHFLPSFLYPKGYEEKEIGFSIHHRSIWINLWTSTMNWRKGDWSWSINPIDILFGRRKYSEETVEEVEVALALPERTYAVTVRRFWGVWRRGRSPFTRRLLRADLTPDKPIIVPGKGESAWDCGDTSINNMTCCVKTVGEALGSLYDSVARQRIRYGSGMHTYVGREL